MFKTLGISKMQNIAQMAHVPRHIIEHFKALHKNFSGTTGPKKLTPCIMCVQYIGGCSVHRGVFSTSGGYMSTSGDIMSTSGDILSTSGDVQFYLKW